MATLTFEMAALIQRISNGDVEAIKDLWPLLSDQPFNSKRPFDAIVHDIAALINTLVEDKSDDKPVQRAKVEDPSLERLINQAFSLVDAIVKDTTRK